MPLHATSSLLVTSHKHRDNSLLGYTSVASRPHVNIAIAEKAVPTAVLSSKAEMPMIGKQASCSLALLQVVLHSHINDYIEWTATVSHQVPSRSWNVEDVGGRSCIRSEVCY